MGDDVVFEFIDSEQSGEFSLVEITSAQ